MKHTHYQYLITNYHLPLTLLPLLLYLLTLAPDLTQSFHSADGGELITAAVTGGIPHPPGYPTYLLLGKLFSYLPWGTLAWRFNLLSAVCAAVGLSFLAATLRRHAPPTAVAVTILTLATTPLLWQQAIVAEVYTLNFAVLAALLWALESQRPYLTPFLFALSLTTHLTSAFWGVAVSYQRSAVSNQLKANSLKLTANSLQLTAYSFLLGCTPWLLLPLWAGGDSPVVWGDPTTLAGWWWLVSAELYRPNVLALPWAQVGERLGAWATAALWQWAAVGWLAVGWGMWQGGQRTASLWLTTAVIPLYTLHALTYAKDDAAVILLPTLLLLAPWLARGLADWPRAGWLLPLAMLALHLPHMDTEPTRPWATAVLTDLPPHAILLTTGDEATFALWYLHHAEGLRPDVTIVDTDLLAFEWYRRRLQRLEPELAGLAEDDLAAVMQENARPFRAWPD